MKVYVIRRLLQVPPMLLAITVLAFMVIRVGPVSEILNRESPPDPTPPATIEARVRHWLGTDQPVWLHYLRWPGVMKQEDGRFSGVLEGDLGQSLWGDETYH